MNSLIAHGLPLVQQAIAACAEVLIDLDAEGEAAAFAPHGVVCLHDL